MASEQDICRGGRGGSVYSSLQVTGYYGGGDGRGSYGQHYSDQQQHHKIPFPQNDGNQRQDGSWASRSRGGGQGQMRRYGEGRMYCRTQGKKQSIMPMFETDYDFEKNNAQFEKIRKKLLKTKIDSNTRIGGDEKKKDSGKKVVVSDSEPQKAYYNKEQSFFDSISYSDIERSKGRLLRTDWRKVQKLNSQTFGVSMTPEQSIYRGGSEYSSLHVTDYYGGGDGRGGYGQHYSGQQQYRMIPFPQNDGNQRQDGSWASRSRGGGQGQMRRYGEGRMYCRTQGKKQSIMPMFETDYDFEKNNAQFEKIRKKLLKTKIDSNTRIGGDEKKKDSGKKVVVSDSEPQKAYYNKEQSFFDSISYSDIERSKGRLLRTDWRKVQKLNSQTFGVSMTPEQSIYRGGSEYSSLHVTDYYGGGDGRGGYGQHYSGQQQYRMIPFPQNDGNQRQDGSWASRSRGGGQGQMRRYGEGRMYCRTQGKKQSIMPMFETDYDFEKNNAQFEKIRKKLLKTKIDSNTRIGGDEKKKDSGKKVVVSDSEPQKAYYNKEQSFFDSISYSDIERSKGRLLRTDWRKVQKLNSQTFGVSMTPEQSIYRGGSEYSSLHVTDYYGGGDGRGGYGQHYSGQQQYRMIPFPQNDGNQRQDGSWASRSRGGGQGQMRRYGEGRMYCRTQGKKQSIMPMFETDYDFEKNNAQFEKIRKKLLKTKIDSNTRIGGDEKKKDSGKKVVVSDSEPQKVYYNKEQSFFDSISYSDIERSKGRLLRTDWRKVQKLNSQTFGVAMTPEQCIYSGGRGGSEYSSLHVTDYYGGGDGRGGY